MYIQQADLFWGMNRDFVKEIMDITDKETFQKGDFLFREGDPATYFYILIKGRVKLIIGEDGPVVHTVDHAGEAFGWSSLIDRDVYSASAECTETTTLQKIDRRIFHKIVEKDATNGLIFFKRLAGLIGYRLLRSYQMVTSASIAEGALSFGTEQVEESEAAS
ncbi:MAG: cyclic nucleotide-binding domain-containing protein [Desulfobacterales bacterium]|nr:MAG: cyclic nucleotide-binding domain-containing protein [Desulfobacterales bacterium]UCD89112.1 MAG: cyclic nucleotide-binding domain-containing protein [Desulfobacterales bacterium]